MNNDRFVANPPTPLAAKSAFVVHLIARDTDTSQALLGRVEHVTTGQSLRFGSVAELVGFMQRTLASNP